MGGIAALCKHHEQQITNLVGQRCPQPYTTGLNHTNTTSTNPQCVTQDEWVGSHVRRKGGGYDGDGVMLAGDGRPAGDLRTFPPH